MRHERLLQVAELKETWIHHTLTVRVCTFLWLVLCSFQPQAMPGWQSSDEIALTMGIRCLLDVSYFIILNTLSVLTNLQGENFSQHSFSNEFRKLLNNLSSITRLNKKFKLYLSTKSKGLSPAIYCRKKCFLPLHRFVISLKIHMNLTWYNSWL